MFDISAHLNILLLFTLQRKRVKRKKSHAEKNQSPPETSPEALEETWKIVEEELRATGFQVSVGISLKGEHRAYTVNPLL